MNDFITLIGVPYSTRILEINYDVESAEWRVVGAARMSWRLVRVEGIGATLEAAIKNMVSTLQGIKRAGA